MSDETTSSSPPSEVPVGSFAEETAKERLVRLETKINNSASKEDIAELKATIHREAKIMLWGIMAPLLVTIMVALLGKMFIGE